MSKVTLILLWLVGFKIRTPGTMNIVIFLRFNAVQSSRSILTFRRNLLSPSSAEPLILYLLFIWLIVRP